ncbi:CPBP family intramembrane glutamic endopeptidase [Baaleninema sp.]|uniref:CPBP family intramembrane glutamic endopeptidase n=1 Tax=Baaleninema sp. TaxID=3101197 RepID=UPI003CFC6001
MTDRPPPPETESLTRTQILIAMGITAIVLLGVAKLWLRFGTVELLPLYWNPNAILWGAALSLAIVAASSLLYRLWPAYRESAQFYLELVIAPLAWPDLLWLGLLPGMSEELLFRGVMLPALGLNPFGLALSSVCFGALHLSNAKQWPYTIWATVVGGLLGASAWLSGNLLVPIVVHVLTNWMSACLWKFRQFQGS